MNPLRYELVFSDDTGTAEDVVVVERTPLTGSGGHPVYADPTGIIRAEISDRNEVRILATGAHQQISRQVRARALPDPEDPSSAAA
ncbi:DUF6296 family protein [Streptomyces litmocidini]|uniref:DUF6296 family protein n=1 Tax=Streptomyces litmocidini TaxID=67318 RepID=UPI00167C54D9|nr:DUF6296 family protein [Streptomyces litmocidini]